MRDQRSDLSIVQSLAPAARTEDADGTGVDLLGFEAATIEFSFGAWTDGVHTGVVEESDDDSTYTAVASTDLIGNLPIVDAADEDNTVHTVGYRGGKRYVRAGFTVATATTGAVTAANVIRGHARVNPVTE